LARCALIAAWLKRSAKNNSTRPGSDLRRSAHAWTAFTSDKLDGKVDEAFWTRKMTEWRDREHALEAASVALSTPRTDEQFADCRTDL